MAGDGNHPLDPQQHYDEFTLEAFVLGQLPLDEEASIQKHLRRCPVCRARCQEIAAQLGHIQAELREALDRPEVRPRLSFEPIASQWRKPPHRVTWLYRVQQLAPSLSTLLMLGLFVIALVAVLPASDTAAWRSLALVDEYYGPPALVAAATDQGTVLVRLAPDRVEIVTRLRAVTNPHNLQFSPDAAWLALQDGPMLTILQTSGSGAYVKIPVRESAQWSWSPDSEMLAYTDGAGQLAVFHTQSQENRVLVPSGENAWGQPVWSSDSQQIAYATVDPPPPVPSTRIQQSIWRVSLETGFRVELARNPHPADTLLVPSAWIVSDSALVAWDIQAGATGQMPALFRVDVAAHSITSLDAAVPAEGTRLAWPAGPRESLFAMRNDRLITLDLKRNHRTLLPDQLLRPSALAWSPGGAWVAYTVAGMPGGEGLYLYALNKRELQPLTLPDGASERSVVWMGPEHLFVVRQPQHSTIAEIWLVPLSNGGEPQRIMTNIRQPQTGPFTGWRWQDVLAAQLIR